MTYAICVRCGAMKFGSLVACKSCGKVPVSGRQLVYSFLFSDHYIDLPQLEEWSRQALDEGIALPLLAPDQEAEWAKQYSFGREYTIPDEQDVLSGPESREDTQR